MPESAVVVYGDQPPLPLSADGANKRADHVHANSIANAVDWFWNLPLGAHGEASGNEELGSWVRLAW